MFFKKYDYGLNDCHKNTKHIMHKNSLAMLLELPKIQS